MKNLVVFCSDTFGDLVLRQSFFKSLLDFGYQVTVVMRKNFTVLMPFLDPRLNVITYQFNPYELRMGNVKDIHVLQKEIAATKPDALISVQYFYTDLDAWMMLLFPQVKRYGFDNALLTDRFKVKFPAVYFHLKRKGIPIFDVLLEGFKESDHEFSKTKAMFEAITGHELTQLPQLQLPASLVEQNKNLLASLGLKSQEYVLASIAGNTNMPIKLLPVDVSAKIIVYLYQQYQLPSLLIGVKSEEAHLLTVANLCKEAGVEPKVWIGSADTFSSLLALIQASKFYYGCDTGAMHFAAALNVPVAAHFGGGTWPRFLPLAKRSYVVTQKLACFACGWDCWAKAPLCINMVPYEKLCKAVDWILTATVDANMVDEGNKIDAPLDNMIRAMALAHKKQHKVRMVARVLSFYNDTLVYGVAKLFSWLWFFVPEALKPFLRPIVHLVADYLRLVNRGCSFFYHRFLYPTYRKFRRVVMAIFSPCPFCRK